jgi:hypothetical protein
MAGVRCASSCSLRVKNAELVAVLRDGEITLSCWGLPAFLSC